ncbi:MAG TPA: DUF2971 domain-containing protein [Terrimicrobiaceae bacterium]
MSHFIYSRDNPTELFRVFQIEHLRDWITGRRLYFPRPQGWEDPFENILLKQRYHQAGTNIPLDFSDVLDRYFGQCWSNAPNETDATWRIYAPAKNGARVCTTVERMYGAFERAFEVDLTSDFYICRVDYFEGAAILKRASLAMQCLEAIQDKTAEVPLELLTVKRPEFEHEQEVRLIFHDKTHISNAGDSFIWIPSDPREVITSVTLDPRLDEAVISKLKAEFESALPGIDVKQSTLYHLDSESVPVYLQASRSAT